MGKLGELDKDIKDKWIFFSVLRKYPEIIFIEHEISLSFLYKLYAVIQMDNDYEMAKSQYDQKQYEIRNKMNSLKR